VGQRVTCRLCAEYHQFYLLDEAVKQRIPEEGTDAELVSRLMVRPHLVLVLTFQPNLVAVAVEAVGAEPPLDPAAWDHVAECDLQLPSGRFAVDQCVGTVAARLSVPPGHTGCGSAWVASVTGPMCRTARTRRSVIKCRCGPAVPDRWWFGSSGAGQSRCEQGRTNPSLHLTGVV
jgi:hypothetical protein